MTHNKLPMQILIADDDVDFRKLLEVRCRSMGFDVLTAGDAMDALATIDFYGPEVVILDVRMPGGNGVSVAEMLATQPRLQQAHVIIMTGQSNGLIEERCRVMGATLIRKDAHFWDMMHQCLERVCETSSPDDAVEPLRKALCESPDETPAPGIELVIPEIHAPSQTSPTKAPVERNDLQSEPSMDAAKDDQASGERPWILVVDDDLDVMAGIEKRLASHGIDVVKAERGSDGYREAFRMTSPAAVLLDYHMPDGDGEYVLRRLRESSATSGVPVIFVTGQRDAALKRRMLSAGASAFLNKPAQWEEIRKVLMVYTDLKFNSVHRSDAVNGPTGHSGKIAGRNIPKPILHS